MNILKNKIDNNNIFIAQTDVDACVVTNTLTGELYNIIEEDYASSTGKGKYSVWVKSESSGNGAADFDQIEVFEGYLKTLLDKTIKRLL